MELRATKFRADYKIFCDESCHLPHDQSNVMVFGAIICEADRLDVVLAEIKQLRNFHNYHQELKWTKLIARQIPFYADLIQYFADTPCLRFKATIVSDKKVLDHEKYNSGSHGDFYYKMAYYALKDFFVSGKAYRIYLDYMDTLGFVKARRLQEILANGTDTTVQAQIIRSHESQLIQLCDLFIGAIAYANRTDIPGKNSEVKSAVIKLIEKAFRRKCSLGTPPWEDKFNLFMFSPRIG